MISEFIKKKRKEKRQTRDGAEQVSSLRSCPLSPSSPSLKGEGSNEGRETTRRRKNKRLRLAGKTRGPLWGGFRGQWAQKPSLGSDGNVGVSLGDMGIGRGGGVEQVADIIQAGVGRGLFTWCHLEGRRADPGRHHSSYSTFPAWPGCVFHTCTSSGWKCEAGSVQTQTDVNRMHEDWKPVPQSSWVYCPPRQKTATGNPGGVLVGPKPPTWPRFFTYMRHYITVIYICATVTVQLEENLWVYFNNFSVIIHFWEYKTPPASDEWTPFRAWELSRFTVNFSTRGSL